MLGCQGGKKQVSCTWYVHSTGILICCRNGFWLRKHLSSRPVAAYDVPLKCQERSEAMCYCDDPSLFRTIRLLSFLDDIHIRFIFICRGQQPSCICVRTLNHSLNATYGRSSASIWRRELLIRVSTRLLWKIMMASNASPASAQAQ